MKIQTSIKRVPTCLMAVVLTAIGAAMTVQAAAPALQGQITLRPLSPQDIKDYGLTGLQGASGLNTVGIGQPVYLEALVNAAIAPSNILSVTWTLTNRPVGSVAVLENSPLGTNVPTYRMADRFNNSGAPVYQVAGRTLLRPDVTGIFGEQYTVLATIVTAGSGTTNLVQNVTAGRYLGINACALCHTASPGVPAKVLPWSQTPHATFFTRAIDGLESSHYGKNCISCHTVGYDTNSLANNGGFDDVAKQVGWTFPAVLTNGNWAAMPASLQNVANIQCENCHGPGSQHAFFLGNTNLISVSYVAGNCAQCHDSKPNHSKSAEWNNSLHARATRTPSGGANRAQCARCHTGGGFAQYADTLGTTNIYTIANADTTYTAITCATCHDPHDASNPHQLRAGPNITLGDGTTVTNAGAGGFCMNCHQSRNGSVSNSIVKFPLGQQTWLGGSAFGVHDNPAGDMLEGVNGWTYGQDIPSSAHRFAVTDTCAACHMNDHYSTNSASPAFTHVGGHSFSMSWSDGTNTYENVESCKKCHGEVDSFDMVKVDYNGDGVIEGVQTEVQKLLNKLSTMLPPTNYVASGNYVADGLVKSPSARTNWQSKFLKAAYNWQFVNNDLSKGVHNAAYAVGLLKASIGDLTGDVNNDGLPDAWQTQYFGVNWASNPNAAPNATPAGDGVPNWLKYSLGLNPLDPWGTIPGGFVWGPTIPVGFVSGPSLANPQGTNTVEIYTAAEVAFNTQVGTTYQIQSSPSVNGNFENLGGSIAGTGGAISYLTPTRDTTNMFFRVVHTP